MAGERRLTARLVVAADGADSLVKRAGAIASEERAYGQVALITNVRSDCTAGAIAFERFTESGPLALLPRHDGSYALIWTLPPTRAEQMQNCSEREFCELLQQRFGWRAGRFEQIGRRASYPLELVHARSSSGQRMALIGNAAQALHPVAAQGFNLGLRDAAMLAELITSAGDPGAVNVLAEFARRRASDRRGMIAFTDRLVRLFNDPRPAVAALRDLGLLLFDVSPPAKRALAHVSWGFGPLPRLARGLSLARSVGAGARSTGGAVMSAHDAEVAIVGSGLAGACTAALLARYSGIAPERLLLIDGVLPPPLPPQTAPAQLRVVAISRASEHVLRASGAWDHVRHTRLCPYERMRVWHESAAAEGAAALCFDAAEVGEPDLGYIGESAELQAACLESFRAAGGQLLEAPLQTLVLESVAARLQLGTGRELRVRLVVGADGARSLVRLQARLWCAHA